VTFVKSLSEYHVTEKQSITLEVEVSKANQTVVWFSNGQPLQLSDRVTVKSEGTKHYLIISSSVLDDEGVYTVKFGRVETSGKLIVDGENI